MAQLPPAQRPPTSGWFPGEEVGHVIPTPTHHDFKCGKCGKALESPQVLTIPKGERVWHCEDCTNAHDAGGREREALERVAREAVRMKGAKSISLQAAIEALPADLRARLEREP